MQFKAIYVSSGCLLTLLIVGGLLSLKMTESRGQDAVVNANSSAADQEVADSVAADNEGYIGSDGCVQCHQGLSPALNSDSFVPLTEPKVWLTDPHSKAFEFILWSNDADPSNETPSQQLSREICRKLAIPDIVKAKECMSCHANLLTERRVVPSNSVLGVTCESCHGPGDQWEREHAKQEWRTQSVDYKTDKGMVDVRNPVQRAEQCFSCHIGDVQQGKWITHKMYAAGHPPLPSIEIESFARQMPRHWRYLKEKIADSRQRAGAANANAPPFKFFEEFVQQNHAYLKATDAAERLAIAERHHHGTAAVVLGGAVALRESIELARDLARPDSKNLEPWPELAAFDCTACHHDLKQPDARRTGDSGPRPGRPTWHAWPTALIQLAIFHISTGDSANQRKLAYGRKLAEFEALLAAVQDNFEATPFGDPSQLQKDATRLSQWLTDELITPVAAKPFDSEAVQFACRRLAHIGSQGKHDYDSARQIAWALRTAYCDLEEKPAGDPTIRSLLRQLADDLRLDLPNSSGEFCEDTATGEASGEAPSDIPIALVGSASASLATEVRYDPTRFSATMSKLRLLLD